jgi:hypothetical protein
MKKVFQFLGQLFGVAKGPLVVKVIDSLGEKLEEFAVKQPQAAENLASSLYVWLKTTLADAAAKTKTDIDDIAVEEALSEIEEFAAKHGLSLPTLP